MYRYSLHNKIDGSFFAFKKWATYFVLTPILF